MTSAIATQIASSFGLSEPDLLHQSLISFLLDKKRQTMQIQFEILKRYGADSMTDLENKIEQGVVVEHPAWEDLIVTENLTTRLEELNGYLADLQKTGNNRTQ